MKHRLLGKDLEVSAVGLGWGSFVLKNAFLSKGTVIRTVPFLMPRFPKMLKNGLNTEVLISLIIKLDFFR